MQKIPMHKAVLALVAAACISIICGSPSSAAIDGITGTTFNLTAKTGNISAGDGRSIFIWGFANNATGGVVQYPGPTLLLAEGATVTVNLTNTLGTHVSILFNGMANVSSTGGVSGLLTREAAPLGGTVSYTFTAPNPGTYYYHSGTDPGLQVEMGLFGAIIVYPADNPAVGGLGRNGGKSYAYDDTATSAYDSSYDREFLFLESEMDPRIHDNIQRGMTYDTSTFWPSYWFLNGRNAPDTMLDAGAGTPWLQTQPYNCAPMMYPGQRILMRVINIGRDPHPYHHHANHARIIARDGVLLESVPGVSGADLSHKVFTIPTVPGQTVDAIFEWTGTGLGYDVYGHAPADALQPNEDPTYHGIPIPPPVPHREVLTFGAFYSGSPYLGKSGELPPNQGGYNPANAFVYMWHSHAEKEMVNNDIFPGGMMTMLFIEPWPAP